MITVKNKRRAGLRDRFELLDLVILIILITIAAMIVFPLLSVIATSFATQKEYLESKLLLFPKDPTVENYYRLFQDGRIWIGYRTTLIFLVIGVPLNLFLTTTLSYGLSRTNFPGSKFFFYAILFTMLFNGGIVPLYLLMLSVKLTNTIWSVILAYGVNSFYFIIMRTNMAMLPESLVESAKLDGANEWLILLRIVLPQSRPIVATIMQFYGGGRWNS